MSQWQDKELAIHGFVQSGSIDEHIVDHEIRRTFVLEHGGKRLAVRHKGPKPDTFKDRSEVVAIGHLVHDTPQTWLLDATDLEPKCPSRY